MSDARIEKSPLPLPHQYVDTDPAESQEWLDSLASMAREEGADRARFIMREMQRQAADLGLGVPDVRQTDYINSIHP
ncbi:MAG: pyruvate dehydrogenase component, partial [Actinomycetota bacterium]|nr:pyruvate dehydrogenase component [Actinomycetota bacterium]